MRESRPMRVSRDGVDAMLLRVLTASTLAGDNASRTSAAASSAVVYTSLEQPGAAEEVLMREGLALDGAHAVHLASKWRQQNAEALQNQTSFGREDQSQEERKTSGHSTSVQMKQRQRRRRRQQQQEPQDEDSSGTDDEEEKDNEEEYLEAISSHKLPKLLATARKHVAKLFPGLQALSEAKASISSPLAHGDTVELCASGVWMTRASHSANIFNGFRRLFDSDFCLQKNASQATACTFRIRKLYQPDVPIHFGDTIELVPEGAALASGYTLRVKLVCAGRYGPIYHMDHVFLVGVSAPTDAPTWTLVAAQSARLQGVRALKRIDIVNSKGEARMYSSPTCFTIHKHGEPVVTPVPGDKNSASMDVSVLVYNAWMMPQIWNSLPLFQCVGVPFSPGNRFRAKQAPRALLKELTKSKGSASPSRASTRKMSHMPGHEEDNEFPDVVILCEAFSERAGSLLKAGLKREFGLVFETPTGGSDPFVESGALINSGVCVLSRYPIVQADFHSYRKSWGGRSRFTNKGVFYVRIEKNGRPVNVLASHLEAWDSPTAVTAREKQFFSIQRIIQSLNLAKNEPVIIAGNMNICRVQDADQYDHMLDILNAKDPSESEHKQSYSKNKKAIPKNSVFLGKPSNLLESKSQSKTLYKSAVKPHRPSSATTALQAYSFDVVENIMEEDPASFGRLNHCLFSAAHSVPKSAQSTLLRSMSTNRYSHAEKHKRHTISDHYPVLTRFQF